MARKPVTITAAADTRQVAVAIDRGIVDPLDEMVAALKDADRAADDTGDTLTDAMRDAQRATEKLDAEQKTLQDTLEKGSKSGAKKFADNTKAGMSKAGEATEEFKAEALSNVSEVASSFTGDMNSAIDLVQGTLGGLVGSIPGIGVALGVAGAAFGALAATAQKRTEEAKARVQEMYDDMLSAGSEFLSKEFIQDQISKIVTGADGAAISMKNLQRISKDTGIEQSDLLLAFGGDMETRTRLIEDLTDKVVDLEGASKRAGEGTATAQDLVTIAASQALRKLKQQNTEAGRAVTAFQAQETAVSKLNATQGRTFDDMTRNQGEAYDGMVSIREAAEAIPTDIKSNVTVTAKVRVDERALFTGIQGALDRKKFKVYTGAYSAPNRNGIPSP